MTMSHSEPTANKWLLYSGLLGMLGALVTGIGEYFLLYAPELNHGAANNYANFLHPTESQLYLGYYLGAFAAPFYILAYWHIVAMLRLRGRPLGYAIMALAVFGFMSGLVWLLSNAYQGLLVQAIAANEGAAVDALLVVQTKIDKLSFPLLQVIRGQVMLMSLILAFVIFRGGTLYPRWIAVFNPFVLILLVFSTLLYAPDIGKYFVPEALNVAHTIFLAISSLFAAIALRAQRKI